MKNDSLVCVRSDNWTFEEISTLIVMWSERESSEYSTAKTRIQRHMHELATE